MSVDSAYFSGFSVIVASNVSPAVAIALSDLCDASNTPLVALQSMGFLGTCRVQTRGHEIVESHPESALVDLGLTTCFPQLEEHCAGLDLAAMSSMERSHVPYIVLLHLALKRWKSEHVSDVCDVAC
jgi:NEDD8-activating enzyme E1 regulatory subunit